MKQTYPLEDFIIYMWRTFELDLSCNLKYQVVLFDLVFFTFFVSPASVSSWVQHSQEDIRSENTRIMLTVHTY